MVRAAWRIRAPIPLGVPKFAKRQSKWVREHGFEITMWGVLVFVHAATLLVLYLVEEFGIW